MIWNSDLKIAIIEENIDKIGILIQSLPEYKNKEDAQDALALIAEAIKLVDTKKQEALASMQKLKKAKSYFS